MSRALAKLSTLELERELLSRAIDRHDENINRLDDELVKARNKQHARLCELRKLTARIADANIAAVQVASVKRTAKKPAKKKGGAS